MNKRSEAAKLKLNKAAKPKTARRKLSPVLPRLVTTWRLFWSQRVKLMALAAVVAVPSTFLRSYQQLSTDFSLILFGASLYCLLALIYFCKHIDKAGSESVASIYTRSSGRFLQLLGVTLLQSLALVPGIFAAVLLTFIGSFNLPTTLYIPGIITLGISFVVLASLSLAQFAATCESLTIWQSLRASWQRTKRSRLRIVLNFAGLFVVVAAISSLLFFLVNLSSLLATSWFVQGLVSSALIVVFLPWVVIYGYSIYDELS